MERSSEPLQRALATLQTRWGSAAVRLGDGRPAGSAAAAGRGSAAVHGALALAVLPDSLPGAPQPTPGAPQPTLGAPQPSSGAAAGVISTGFPELDAILGPGGLPAEASVVVRGGPSVGKTTLALRTVAEAQAGGEITAWLDLARAFDPVEAVARGVDLRWLLVLRPADLMEGLALAGSLLSGHCTGTLVVDLPARLRSWSDDGLRRLVAHARRTGARLLVLEPASLGGSAPATLARSTSLRLELERRAWLRLGRDVVGQRTAVVVAKNRYGPPGRSVDLDIHYLAEGERAIATHRLIDDETERPEPSPERPEPSPEPTPLRPSPSGPMSSRVAPHLVVV